MPQVVHEVSSTLETTNKKPLDCDPVPAKPRFEDIKMNPLNLKDNSPIPDNISVNSPQKTTEKLGDEDMKNNI